MLRRRASHSETDRPAWTIVLASIGAFMGALDTLVVTTSLPVLRTGLHASLASLEWTVNAYNLAFACLLLTGAALGDRFGRRKMYTVGLSLFTAASAAAALSPSVGALVAARSIQGVGGAIVLPLTLTLISQAFPPQKRGRAIGLWGGISGLGIAIGPVVGGAVVTGISWHWIFWINVPVGLVTIPLASRRLKESFGPARRVDVTGLVLAGAGALAITWGLVRATSAGWGSAEVIGALAAGSALIGALMVWERRAASPMLDLSLFRRRTFAGANAVSFLMYGGLFGALFLMSQFFQNALGDSALTTGVRLLPWSLPPLFIAPVAGRLADRYGNRPFMALGLSMQALGLGLVAGVASTHASYSEIAPALTIAGIGSSFCYPTVANAVMGSVPATAAGVASGTSTTLRQLGGVVGVAVMATVFERPGVYTSPHTFVTGFTQALWVAVGFSVLGVIAALATAPGRQRPDRTAPSAAIVAEQPA